MQPIGGFHHVTAITGRAAANLDFYRRVLGMRLVKKTVNQDDPGAYHLFYADAHGTPGTELTFFEWPHAGPNAPGSGTVAETAFRAAGGRAALAGWAERLRAAGARAVGEIEDEAEGGASLAFADPEGQRLRLVAADGAEEERSAGTLQALESVTLTLRRSEKTIRVLTEALGFQPAGEDSRGLRFRIAGEAGPSAQSVRVLATPDADAGHAGIGGVHHVAFRVPDAAAQLAWRERLAAAGLVVSAVIDRYYFKAIYFREPGGVLFEISTEGPGFAADEDPAHLGETLALPPFLEPQRARIEMMLAPLNSVAL